MATTNLEKMLGLLSSEAIHFGDYVSSTRREYRAMAAYLAGRWPPPEWYLVEDIEQELYLATWRRVWKFDPTRGKTISQFVTFNAIADAKRELHRARGVSTSGSPDKRPSRFEVPASFLGEPGAGDEILARVLAEPAIAEERLAERDDSRTAAELALPACLTPFERCAVMAIKRAGSLDAAGLFLYDNIDYRIGLRLDSEQDADRFVMRNAGAVANRIAGERF